MPDAVTAEVDIPTDAEVRLKLSDAAVQRGMRRLNASGVDDLGEKLGFSRLKFYRLRTGKHDIRLSEALAVAEQLGWPLTRVFEPVGDRRGR